MILSVVVPKLQLAQWKRIDEEFKDIEYEIIPHKDPAKALSLVTGRFILFLEEDSAFEKGQLYNSLDIFRSNPSYRKLAMVCSAVDFDTLPSKCGFGYDNGITGREIDGDDPYPVSIGYFYGSIIRTTAYRDAIISHKKDALYKSAQLSDFLWSNGLRIEMNPKSTYFAPPDVDPKNHEHYRIKSNSLALKVWNKEFIL